MRKTKDKKCYFSVYLNEMLVDRFYRNLKDFNDVRHPTLHLSKNKFMNYLIQHSLELFEETEGVPYRKSNDD